MYHVATCKFETGQIIPIFAISTKEIYKIAVYLTDVYFRKAWMAGDNSNLRLISRARHLVCRSLQMFTYKYGVT